MSTISNSVRLFGRLTSAPNGKDINTQKGQMRMIRFNVACQRRGKDAGADFPQCVAYGKTAEFIEKFFQKGSLIILDGHIQTGSYTKNDGTKVYTTDVVVDEWGFGGSKSDNQIPQNNAPQAQNSSASSAPTQNAQQNDVFSGFSSSMPDNLPFQ